MFPLFGLFPLFWLFQWTVLSRIVLGAALDGPDVWVGLHIAVVWAGLRSLVVLAGLSPGIWGVLGGLSAGFTVRV